MIGIVFPVSRVALSEGRSPQMTGAPSVVKNTWPLLFTFTALVSTTAPVCGLRVQAEGRGVVSRDPS